MPSDLKRGKLRITASSSERMAELLQRLVVGHYCDWQRGARLLLRWP